VGTIGRLVKLLTFGETLLLLFVRFVCCVTICSAKKPFFFVVQNLNLVVCMENELGRHPTPTKINEDLLKKKGAPRLVIRCIHFLSTNMVRHLNLYLYNVCNTLLFQITKLLIN
jgi:hypothetical protein